METLLLSQELNFCEPLFVFSVQTTSSRQLFMFWHWWAHISSKSTKGSKMGVVLRSIIPRCWYTHYKRFFQEFWTTTTRTECLPHVLSPIGPPVSSLILKISVVGRDFIFALTLTEWNLPGIFNLIADWSSIWFLRCSSCHPMPCRPCRAWSWLSYCCSFIPSLPSASVLLLHLTLLQHKIIL